MHAIHINPLARAMGVFGIVAALVTGVTFAALNTSATLTNNTISTANASLLVWDGDSFEASAPGFTITDLVPGEGKTDRAYLKNAGAADVDLSFIVPAAPVEPTEGYGFSGWENLTVKIVDDSDAANCYVNTNMLDLLAGAVEMPEGCELAAGAQGNNSGGAEDTEGNYSFTFDINPESITGSQASVGAFDIVINGSQTAHTE